MTGKNTEGNPYIIGIAGDSASGKSTIANFIRIYYGYDVTTLLSGDDLHRYERGDVMWDTLTHLNPLANNLKMGDNHLTSLKQNTNILRRIYNHSTGKFNTEVSISPKPYIINEGLHSFYTQESEALTDLKIYVDTDENLITDFKVERDTNERGYTKEKVIELISKRKKDSEHIRNVQIKKADVVIKITKMDGIKIVYNSDVNYKLFEFIKSIYYELHTFQWINQTIGNRLSVIQSKGGNISTKLGDNLIIKESGGKLKDVKFGSGYSIIDYKNIDFNSILSDDILDDTLVASVKNFLYKKPSMETGFHTRFEKYVFHIHPIYLNCILSLENASTIIDRLFSDLDFKYTYLKYYNPGLELTHKILNTDDIKNVVFLENHGLIVSSDNYYLCIDLISRINTMAKEYIIKNTSKFKEFDLSWKKHPKENIFTFPDSVIINDDETTASHNYIIHYAKQLGKIKQLSDDDIEYLKNLKSEKYRK